MAKANGESKKGFEAFDPTSVMPTEAMKEAFEKFSSFSGDFGNLGKGNLEALTESAQRAGKGFEAMTARQMQFFKDRMQSNMNAARSMGGVKSLSDLTAMQTEFAKDNFQACFEQMNEMATLFATTAREASEPLSAYAGEMVEKFQKTA